MRVPLSEFVATLPDRSSQPRLREEESQAAFSSVVTAQKGYVWPDVELAVETLDQGVGSSVLLVRAPGAMGKTAAARAVAHRLGCPRIDLSKLRVGSNGLTGLLTQVLGWEQAPLFIQSLRAGESSLVLDSTDEAQLAAGQENYLAFLEDLARLMRGASERGQVLVFGRPDATETTYLGLTECDLVPISSEVCPLSHAQSCELINNMLDAKTRDGVPYEIHRTFAEPFGRLRDQSFFGIAQALEPALTENDYWPKVESFLGYPPVLLALAERLAVDNPQQEVALAAREEGGGRRRQGELLRQVVEDILDRDSGKVRSSVAEALHLSPADPRCEIIYTRDEQCLRLVQRVSGLDLRIDAPASLNPVERARYEELVAGFTADHPFLREDTFANLVFSDYVRAFLATSPLSGAVGLSRRDMMAAIPDAGPFFSHFVHDLALPPRRSSAVVSEELVDDLISSFGGGASWATSTFYQNKGEAILTLAMQEDSAPGEPDFSADNLVFRVTDLSGVLHLTGPLARTLVMTDQGVVLAGVGGNLALGPDVAITATDLQFLAESVTVTGGAKDKGRLRGLTALISVQAAHEAALRVTAHPESALLVSWQDPWHQWKPHAFDIQDLRGTIPAHLSSQVFLGLRRMLLSFGGSTDNDPLVYVDKFDRFAVGSNPVFVATLAALVDLGVIEREPSVYRLRLQALGRFGVVWARLHGDDVSTTLKALHAEVLKHDAVLNLLGPRP